MPWTLRGAKAIMEGEPTKKPWTKDTKHRAESVIRDVVKVQKGRVE